MTTPKEKEVKKSEKTIVENLIFDDSEELILTQKEVEELENKLETKKVDTKTRAFFKSAHQFAKKLKENDYTISLEELEKL